MPALALRAFCKVNLCLEITGRRDDGYHDLSTIFQTVSLADSVTFEVRDEPGIEVVVPEGGAPEGEENLCWEAAHLYWDDRDWPRGVRIELTKAVPSGAGLGGGSSDAAAVLTGLASLDRYAPPLNILREIAADVGSDVPFFLTGGTAFGRGRGEVLVPLPDLPACRILLVRPDLQISTAEAYGMLEERDLTDRGHAEEMAEAIGDEDAAGIADHVFNGFARVLEERWPVLGELKDKLREHGAVAAEITGSGAAVFGIFDDHAIAETAGRALADEGCWARLTEPVPCGAMVVE
jgi:4-diphosphocytidyl-2-C-methyl-D-erythritol kinase